MIDQIYFKLMDDANNKHGGLLTKKGALKVERYQYEEFLRDLRSESFKNDVLLVENGEQVSAVGFVTNSPISLKLAVKLVAGTTPENATALLRSVVENHRYLWQKHDLSVKKTNIRAYVSYLFMDQLMEDFPDLKPTALDEYRNLLSFLS